MKIDAFGRKLELVQKDGEWLVFALGEGKKSPIRDLVIPAALDAAAAVAFIADLLHELATPERPGVVVLG